MARIVKQPDERKQEITTAARKLFCEQGFDETTIVDISNHLNIAQGLIYHYFRSKTDILYAVADELSAEDILNMKKIVSEYEGTAIECLKFMIKRAYALNNEQKKLIFSLNKNQGALEYLRVKRIASISPILTQLIERGNEDNSWKCKYPKESADFILHGLSGSGIFHIKNSFEPFEDIIIRVLGVGL